MLEEVFFKLDHIQISNFLDNNNTTNQDYE